MRRMFALCLALLGGPVAAQDDPEVIAARVALLDGRAQEAVPVISGAAEAGDPRAQNPLDHIHEMGVGRPVDMEEALRWYGLAAAQGYPRAMFNIGYILRWGEKGVAPDQKRARVEIGRAAALDYPPALAAHGDMLLRGEGGPADPGLGIAFLEMGVAMEDSDAMQWLGKAYLEGLGVERDDEKAQSLFERSAA